MTPATAVIVSGAFVLGFVAGVVLCRGLVWHARHLLKQVEKEANMAEAMLLRATNFYTDAAKEHIATQKEKRS